MNVHNKPLDLGARMSSDPMQSPRPFLRPRESEWKPSDRELEAREALSDEHFRVLQPVQREPQVVARPVYQEREVNHDVVLERQVGVPCESIKYVDSITEKEVVTEVPVYIEKETIKYEDRVVHNTVERIKEIPVEVEKIVYVDHPVYKEVIIDVPKPVYVDRVIYKDR